LKPLFLFVFIVALAFPAGGSQEEIPDLENVEIIVTHLSGPVYMLEATGDVAGNIAVSAGDDGILLVDTQYAPLAPKIMQALGTLSQKGIEYIINTHHHEDHTHGNTVLGKSAVIIGHAQTRHRLLGKEGARPPEITFEEEMSLHFNGEEIKLVHYPKGHSDNDVVVFFTGSNVVHLGDLFNSGTASFPTVDLEAGGSVYGMQKNVEQLIRIIPDKAKIIPGHYGVSDLTGLKSTYGMLVETIEIVRRKKASGMSLEQIKKEGLPPEYDSWGTGYADAGTWIENIYLGLN